MKKLISLMIMLVFLVGACGQENEEITDTVEESISIETPESKLSEKSTNGTFRRLWADPPTLDPHLCGDTTSAFIVAELYSGLVALDTELNIVPDIAESWDISQDGKRYVFHLRENAKFHDGSLVTAQDFKWSLERASSPDTESPLAETYLGDIVGVKDLLNNRANQIAGVKVIDKRTLEITIDAPKAYFLAKLTYPTSYVLDQDNVEKGGRNWTDNPNGTGPFKLSEYKIGERIILEPNEYYYRSKAKLDKVVLNLAGGQSMAMYENGEIDITGVGLADLDRVLDTANPISSELVIAPPEFSVYYIGFHTDQPPFDDIKFRQALNYSVDKELIAKELYSDLVVPAYGILPPGMPGYNSKLKGMRFDPEKAKELIAQSKYSDPATRPRIIITSPGTGGAPSLDVEVVTQMWEKTLGVQVEIQNVEWATYLQDLNKQRLQVFAGIGWQADYPDPQNFLDVLFFSKSELNHGAYSNPAVDDILEKARVESNIGTRMGLYNKAEEVIMNDAAWLPLWFGAERYVLIKPYVKGYKMTPLTLSKLKDVYIEND